MRILLLSTRYLPDLAGGVENRFHAMARAALARGWSVTAVATNAYSGLAPAAYELDGVRIQRIAWPEGVDPVGPAARPVIAKALAPFERPDVIWSSNGALALGAQAVFRGAPVVYSPGHTEPLGLQQRLRRAAGRLRSEGWRWTVAQWRREAVADQAIRRSWRTLLGSEQERHYIQAGRGDWPGLHVARRGVTFADWAPARARPPRCDQGPLRALIACRLTAAKNVEHALQALAAAPPEVTLTVCGGGPHEADLRLLAKQLALGDRLTFAGFRRDMPAVYRDADVFIMSSHREPYGNTVLEALASGVPVLMRRPCPPRVVIGGFADLADCPGCLVYDTDDVAGLAAHLSRLAANRAELHQRSSAGVAWAAHRDWGQCIGDYLPSAAAEGKPGIRTS